MTKKAAHEKSSRLHTETRGLLYLATCLLLSLILISFRYHAPHANWLGLAGYGVGWVLFYLCGLTAYGIVLYLGWAGWCFLCSKKISHVQTAHFFIFLFSLAILLNLFAELGGPIPAFASDKIYTESVHFTAPYPHRQLRYNVGGAPFYYLYRDAPGCNLQTLLSDMGIAIVFSLSATVSLILLAQVQVLPLLRSLQRPWHRWWNTTKESAAAEEKQAAVSEPSLPKPPYFRAAHPMPLRESVKEHLSPKEHAVISSKRKDTAGAERSDHGDCSEYRLPPLSLLHCPKKVDQPSLRKDLRKQAEVLEDTLMSFGIEAKVGEIHCGPTITSLEVQPAVGVKVQKITALENDIALNLQAKAIRIIAPIPGKAAVGVEIPSLYPQEVSFKELLQAYQNQSRKCLIPVLLGKTVSGDNVISDLARMPHVIIAGATGSGKSVCINTLVMSVLMNARPDEIKMLMIDPKKVELTSYTQLPHLIAPVITEPHGAYAALQWLVKEMQLRYDILKQLGLRNISAFNTRKVHRELEMSLGIPIPEKMYAIVAIIDEFADLMMVSSSDLETPIARIAQMARAVGIHLVLATQRPSREVITGLIKANFPTRIAFKVASRINSQIILDETGAESLLGNGDMLFLPPGASHLCRAQGAYISDEEIHRVVQFICDQASAKYLIPSFDAMRIEDLEASDSKGPRDSLCEQAQEIVVATGTASTTFLQRKLKIGYARAASLMDELEKHGVIGPQDGAKPRRVLRTVSTKPAYSHDPDALFDRED